MRWSRTLLAISLTAVACGCSTATSPAAAYQPYTCIPVSSPAAVSSTPPVPGTPERIAVIGDSYTSGSPQGGTGNKRWTAVLTDRLRSRGFDVTTDVGAEGGAGYVHAGNTSGGVFADKIDAAVKPEDKVVVFFGSRNDSRALEGEMAHATCEAFRKAETAAPQAQLLVIGPPWVNSSPPASVTRARDIIRNRSQELGLRFIDPIADGWFADRPDLIGTDGVHPTDAGHAYMADKITPLVEQILTGQLSG